MESKWLETTVLRRTVGSGFGWREWHGIRGVKVDVGGMGSSNDISFKVESSQEE